MPMKSSTARNAGLFWIDNMVNKHLISGLCLGSLVASIIGITYNNSRRIERIIPMDVDRNGIGDFVTVESNMWDRMMGTPQTKTIRVFVSKTSGPFDNAEVGHAAVYDPSNTHFLKLAGETRPLSLLYSSLGLTPQLAVETVL